MPLQAPLRDVHSDAVELVKAFEGIEDGDPTTARLDPYLCPAGVWTIGWGHAVREEGGLLRGYANRYAARALYPGGITLQQADTLLRGDLVDACRDVQRLAQASLTDGQFGALVSFVFNIGASNFQHSTLRRLLTAGAADEAVADQFLAWNKSRVDGVLRVLPGLARRRAAERAMFLGLDWRNPPKDA